MSGRKRDGAGRSPPRRRRSIGDSNDRENHYCFYCKVQFTSVKAFESHNQSTVHKQKETLINKAVLDGLQFCYSCEKIFPSKIELDAHALMSRHQPLYRVEELNNVNKKRTSPVRNLSERESQRVNDQRERREIVMKLDNYVEKPSEKIPDKRFFCELCEVDCMNATNLRIHEESWRHRAEADKKKESFDREAEKKFQEADCKSSEVLNYFCEVCSIALPGETPYVHHLQNKKHHRQVALMRRPYKCYDCVTEYQNDKEFNDHLGSQAHIKKAFQSKDRNKKSSKDEWVEKKRGSGRSTNEKNDKGRSEDRNKSRGDTSKSYNRQSRDGSKERRDGSDRKSDRKVEIVSSPADDVSDLREKLQNKKIVVTKPNDQSSLQQNVDPDKRAKELEMETKFKKLEREFRGDLDGLKKRLTQEREKDISMYQQYEATYNKLCQEEDYVRENLRVLDEGDPRKEEYIRDMIRIQNDMREVRQELELREMMIIKRENLFRGKFPNSNDNKVVLNTQEDSEAHEKIEEKVDNGAKQSETQGNETAGKHGDSDLRIQLERERLLKRLGPELEMVDASLREKLLAVIMDKEKQSEQKAVNSEGLNAKKKAEQMKILTDREKQLEKELKELKSKAPVKKITKSLVPQYDDVEEKDKKRVRRRSRSKSSSSSRSSSSSSNDSRSRKRRRRSPKSRSKSKRYSSDDRSRKKHRRSSSREKRKKSSSSRKIDDKKKKEKEKEKERKKPVKITLKSNEKPSKLNRSGNPLPDDSEDDDDLKEVSQPQQVIPVLGSTQVIPPRSHAPKSEQQKVVNKQPSSQAPILQIPAQPRQQFSLWNNTTPVVSVPSAPTLKESPKEDVWDIAFSGGQTKNDDTPSEALNIFNSPLEGANALSSDILNILRSVAPILQNQQQQQQQQQQQHRLQKLQQQQPQSHQKSTQEVPSTINKSPFAATSTESSPNTTAGNRVRSILKKMKEPPKEMIADPEPQQEEEKVQPVIDGIPGLDAIDDTVKSSTSTLVNLDPEETALYSTDYQYQPPETTQKSPQQNNYPSESISRSAGNKNWPIDLTDNSSTRKEEIMTSRYSPVSYRDRSPVRVQPADHTIPRHHISSSSNTTDYYTSPAEPTSYREDKPPVSSAYDRNPYDRSRNDIGISERRTGYDPYAPPERRPTDLRSSPVITDNRPPVRRPGESEDNRLPVRRPADDANRLPARRPADGDNRLPVRRSAEREDIRPPIRRPAEGGDIRPPVRRPADIEDLRPPVKRPGESDDQFYERFEKYYEMKRLREQTDRQILAARRPAPYDEPYRLTPAERYEAQRQRYDMRYDGLNERKPVGVPVDTRRRQPYPDYPRDPRDPRASLPDRPYPVYDHQHRAGDERRVIEQDRRRVELPPDAALAGRNEERRTPHTRRVEGSVNVDRSVPPPATAGGAPNYEYY